MTRSERLLGELSEFRAQAMDRFDRLDLKQDRTDEKVDALQSFKWRVAGGAAVLSMVLSVIAEIVIHVKYGFG